MLSSEVGMKLMKKPLGFQGFLNFRIINRESQIRSQDGTILKMRAVCYFPNLKMPDTQYIFFLKTSEIKSQHDHSRMSYTVLIFISTAVKVALWESFN